MKKTVWSVEPKLFTIERFAFTEEGCRLLVRAELSSSTVPWWACSFCARTVHHGGLCLPDCRVLELWLMRSSD